MTKGYLEIHIYGNLFLDEEVTAVYRHSPKGEWKHGTTISLNDIDVKVVDTKRAGYRFYDTDSHRFIPRYEVERRLAERIRQWQNGYFGGDFVPLDGGVSHGGDAEWHGVYD